MTANLFMKGESGNPNGRPKGAVGETTRKFSKIKDLAANKCEDAFNILWNALESGESWAHQLYWKELVPKKMHQPTIKFAPLNNTVEGQMEAIRDSLPELEELTHDEAMNTLKTLGTLKLVDNAAKENRTLAEALTDEQLKQLNEWVKDSK